MKDYALPELTHMLQKDMDELEQFVLKNNCSHMASVLNQLNYYRERVGFLQKELEQPIYKVKVFAATCAFVVIAMLSAIGLMAGALGLMSLRS